MRIIESPAMTETVFHRNPPPWFNQVRDLLPGQRRRIADGKLVSNNGRGFQLFDFREKQSEVYVPTLSLGEKVAWLKAARDAEVSAIRSSLCPPGSSILSDWPSVARAWLWKAGLHPRDVRALGAVWNSRMQRVVVPLRGLHTSYWLARSMQPSKTVPKYLFPAGVSRAEGALFPPPDACRSAGAGVVLVEDFLSAYRIHRDTGLAAVALQGTSLPRDIALWLHTAGFSAVGIWLDPDKWGVRGARASKASLALLDIPTLMITSSVDPKCLSPEEIRDKLQPLEAHIEP